jgi:copper chaperone CopZ
MYRRNFIQRVTCGLAAAETAGAARRTATVRWRIEGFTCITCAVGLDTMLKDVKGVVASKSSYADRMAVIEFEPDTVTEAQIRKFIEEIGFKALI